MNSVRGLHNSELLEKAAPGELAGGPLAGVIQLAGTKYGGSVLTPWIDLGRSPS